MNLPSFIKKHYSLVILTICLIIITIGFLYIKNLRDKLQDEKDKVAAYSIEKNNAVTKIVNTYRDPNGNLHTTIEKNSNKITEKALKDGAVSIGIIDTAAKALKIAKTQIDQLTKVNFQLSQSNLLLQRATDKTTLLNDSLKKQVSSYYKDKFLNLSIIRDSLGQERATYSVIANLSWIDYHKKKIPIIGKDYFYTDIYSENPNLMLIGNQQRVTIEHAERSFGLRFKTSLNYNFTRKQVFPGIGAEIRLNRINVSGYYYYDFARNITIPTLRLDYDFATF